MDRKIARRQSLKYSALGATGFFFSALPGCSSSLLQNKHLAYTFFKAEGQTVGKSLCEDDFLDEATKLLKRAKDVGCEIVLPVDNVAADEFKAGAGANCPVFLAAAGFDAMLVFGVKTGAGDWV